MMQRLFRRYSRSASGSTGDPLDLPATKWKGAIKWQKENWPLLVSGFGIIAGTATASEHA
jgi:hypothetical protein